MLTLDLVKKAIEGKDEFRIFERDGFIVVDYMISKADTFMHEDPELQKVLRELRGVAFSADGQRVISLPYHKFFNIGEKDETHISKINFENSHVVLDKLDGSMIRTIPVTGGFRLGTRAGITNVSMQAERFWVRPDNYERYKKFFQYCEDAGETPIFEYVGPNNRIVLHYAKEDLILTAIRHRATGAYVLYNNMVKTAKNFKIPCVDLLFDSSDKLLERVAILQNLEGAVVRFNDGLMVKVKADDYVDKHRAVGQLKLEKDVLKLIFSNTLDDVLPILNDDVRKKVEEYRTKVVESANEFKHRLNEKYEAIIDSLSEEIQDSDDRTFRREFALAITTNERWKRDSKFLFNMVDGKEINIAEVIISKCGTQASVDSMRHIIGKHKLWEIDLED